MQYINYRESRQRGTIDFPFEHHHVSPSHPQYNMALHWHVEFEIIRILAGKLTITIDEHQYTVGENNTIFIPAGCVHAGEPKDCIYECIVFDMNTLMNKNDSCCRLIRKINDHEIEPYLVFNENYKEIHSIIWNMFDAITNRKEGYQLLVLGSLYSFFGIIYANEYFNAVPVQPPRNHKRILQLKTALEYMESSYSKPITLEDISGAVNMSPKYFCRFFQEMTHRTPIDYLNYYRIERACYQILTTDQTITEIAYNSGFNDLSYFIKTFKKYKGTTPKKYLNS